MTQPPPPGQTTTESVSIKVRNYLLEPSHKDGGPKAKWFDQALGFTLANSAELEAQIVFDPNTAIKTVNSPYGQKYEQMIDIEGANKRVISVKFIFIQNLDGVVRLVTATDLG